MIKLGLSAQSLSDCSRPLPFAGDTDDSHFDCFREVATVGKTELKALNTIEQVRCIAANFVDKEIIGEQDGQERFFFEMASSLFHFRV